MEVIRSQRRLYPQEGLAAHVIGYVGEISESELDLPEFVKYDQGSMVRERPGSSGSTTMCVMGKDGQRQVVVDNRGNEHEVLATKDAVQATAWNSRWTWISRWWPSWECRGRTARWWRWTLATAKCWRWLSNPTYDPNKFAGRIRSEDWKEIANNPDNPMLDRPSRRSSRGLDPSSDHGAGGAGERRHRRRLQGPLPGRGHFLRALLQMLDQEGTA